MKEHTQTHVCVKVFLNFKTIIYSVLENEIQEQKAKRKKRTLQRAKKNCKINW